MERFLSNRYRKVIFRQWLRVVAGLLVFAFGVHLTIYANIGLAPWDCLGMGISYHTPLNYGIAMTSVAVLVLGIDLLLKENIGFLHKFFTYFTLFIGSFFIGVFIGFIGIFLC